MAKRKRSTSFAGVGALVQGIGLLVLATFCLWWGWVGFAIGAPIALVLFLKGSAMSISWRCGACGNPIHDKHVRMCAVCKEPIE
ncbi:hypothetical protein J2X09_005106 [Hydrogenophaga laconesensis]|uniref:Zinc ribbon domain-containing protein n=1 Tax=Hydrogenophaga laconesensis TaxID=1805971 RepID=A0ABU1VIM1_9BURK|nr:hypothetical protein [Hydrogenophaga laconesensis]